MSMSSVPDTNDDDFVNKMLFIPDYVIPSDIQKIYHYFDYYNIASIKNVTINKNNYKNTNTSYNYNFINEFYHAIIEVEKWHNNNSAYWFYQDIKDNKCKMVYDDPNYWDVEFYFQQENNEVPNQNYLNNQPSLNMEEKYYEEDEENEVNEVNEEDEENEVFDYSYNIEEGSIDSDSYSNYESGSEVDDSNDEDYNFEESDNDEDVLYEYYKMDHNKNNHLTRRKSKKENKKRKFSLDAQKEIEELKEENKSLKALLIRNNKNYLKNNKTKSFKNVWSRRLRQKVSY